MKNLSEENRIADAILDFRHDLEEIKEFLKFQDFTEGVNYKVFGLIGDNYNYKVLGLNFIYNEKPSPDFVQEHMKFFLPFFIHGHQQIVFYVSSSNEEPKSLVWITPKEIELPLMMQEMIQEKMNEIPEELRIRENIPEGAKVTRKMMMVKVEEEEFNADEWQKINL